MALALPVTERYERALQLRAGGLSVREAAEKVGVSKSALARRITGECSVAARNGSRRVLSDDEERAVVDCCVHLAAAGFGFTMQLAGWTAHPVSAILTGSVTSSLLPPL